MFHIQILDSVEHIAKIKFSSTRVVRENFNSTVRNGEYNTVKRKQACIGENKPVVLYRWLRRLLMSVCTCASV